MYDFNKTELHKFDTAIFYKNDLIEFKGEYNVKTGETNDRKKIADYLSIDKFCIIRDDKYTELKFSFHKYFNSGTHNHNDFTIDNFLNVLIDLSDKFNINPFTALLHNIEFGVNIILPFNTKEFLNSIISFKGKEYKMESFSGRGYLLRFEFGQYEVKIYDKGYQYQLDRNILRFEVKVKRMEYLKSKGIFINSYSDLLKPVIIKQLENQLIKVFSELLTYDNTINTDKVKKRIEREILLNGRNPKFWATINNPNTSKKKRKRFREINTKYGSNNLQTQVCYLIKEKLLQITTISNETEQKTNDYLSRYKVKSVPNLTDLVNHT